MKSQAPAQMHESRQPAAIPMPPARQAGGNADFVDSRPTAVALRRLSDMIDSGPLVQRQRAFVGKLSGTSLHGNAPPLRNPEAFQTSSARNPIAPAPQEDTTIQMARAKVMPPILPADLAILEAAINPIDVEINELTTVDTAEVVNGFIDMADIGRWRGNFTVNIARLRALNTGAATFTKEQISARDNPAVNAIYSVLATLANLRNALNTSLKDYTAYALQKDELAQFNAELSGFKSGKDAEAAPSKSGASSSASTPYESPYKAGIGKYDKDLAGAVVLVDGPYVVVMEHYQLKHNPDIGVLSAGGSFKGKKGSTLAGGWAAHRDTFAPAILAHAKTFIPGMGEQTNLILSKARLADIDAYVSITVDGKDWIINYHGNPPE